MAAVQWSGAGGEAERWVLMDTWGLLMAAAMASGRPAAPCQLGGRQSRCVCTTRAAACKGMLSADAGLGAGSDWHCRAPLSPVSGRNVV